MAIPGKEAAPGCSVLIEKPHLAKIIDRLWQDGFTVVGPTIAQGAIVLDEIRGLDQLPIGWTDEQEGDYRLHRRDDDAYFGYAVGPHSWKKYLFPPKLTLFTIEALEGSFAVHPGREAIPKYAFVGHGRAICVPSRSRTARSWAGHTWIRTISAAIGHFRAGRAVCRPPRHAFVPAWERARRPRGASTWR